MNVITDEQIEVILNEQMNYLKSTYDEKQCLGLFTYGKVNYGFAEKLDDIKTVLCYIPSFEELCTTIYPLKIKYITDDKNRKIRICDIRLLYELAISQEDTIIEAIFSKYHIINPRYKKTFDKYIFTNIEDIFNNSKKFILENSIHKGLSMLNQYQEDSNPEKLFEACRLRIACELYISGASCEDCINLKKDYHINYLWQVLKEDLHPSTEEVKDNLYKLLEESAKFSEENDYKESIKVPIMELMKIALIDMMQTNQDFLSILTKTEDQAFNIILNNLNADYEGNISISQLIEHTNISRPVFKNVLQKMKDNLVAEIDNQGVKGTYVKIIDGNILSR